MRKKLFLMLLILSPIITYANDLKLSTTSDSIVRVEVQRLEGTIKSLQDVVYKQKNETNAELHLINEKLVEIERQRIQDLDSLSGSIDMIEKRAAVLDDKIITTKSEISKVDASAHQQIKTRTLYGVITALVLLLVALLIYLWVRKRLSKGELDLGQIRDAQTRLQEESLSLDQKLVEILERQVDMEKLKAVANANDEVDHSLVKKVADEIARIELNLSRMDKDIRGYKQLQRGVERIKNNFLAKGYEIVDMLGKPYVEGMKAVPSFIIDEALPKGSQIITSVTKPQINYNGELLQAAVIIVSQNI